MSFREIVAVNDPGRRELQGFVSAVLKFFGFVLERCRATRGSLREGERR